MDAVSPPSLASTRGQQPFPLYSQLAPPTAAHLDVLLDLLVDVWGVKRLAVVAYADDEGSKLATQAALRFSQAWDGQYHDLSQYQILPGSLEMGYDVQLAKASQTSCCR